MYNYECRKLKNIGDKNLIDKIIEHYEIHETPGWDITSFDEKGNEIFIEVKSTKGSKINQLEITSNEWNAAVKQKEKYYIYLVSNVFKNNVKIEILKNPYKLVENGVINISTSVHQLKL